MWLTFSTQPGDTLCSNSSLCCCTPACPSHPFARRPDYELSFLLGLQWCNYFRAYQSLRSNLTFGLHYLIVIRKRNVFTIIWWSTSALPNYKLDHLTFVVNVHARILQTKSYLPKLNQESNVVSFFFDFFHTWWML